MPKFQPQQKYFYGDQITVGRDIEGKEARKKSQVIENILLEVAYK